MLVSMSALQTMTTYLKSYKEEGDQTECLDFYLMAVTDQIKFIHSWPQFLNIKNVDENFFPTAMMRSKSSKKRPWNSKCAMYCQ